MKKILVIEDNDDVRENTAEILELANYSVITAENGKTGVTQALQNHPDLIVCDIMMPELDGYGVLNIVQRNPALSNTPFIFLTAKAEGYDFRKGMGLGADDYITKPFTGTDLLNSVESRLRKTEKLQQLSPGLEGVSELLDLSGNCRPLQAFVDGRHVDKYKKKQVIYSEGHHPLRLFYIQKGKVKTYVSNEDGKELVVDFYGEGDFFGYTALMEGNTYKDNAAAMEDAEIAVIPKQEFEDLMRTNKQVSEKFIKLLARNVADKEQHLLNLAFNSLRKKVANALVSLKSKYGSESSETFSISLSRENLAAMAGTATESLIRTLSDFKDEKLIEIKDGIITITNLAKLKKMRN